MLNNSITLSTNAGLTDSVTSNRHQILQHLLENKAGMHIDGLTKCLNISRTAVQKYFLMLETEGLIRKHNRFKTQGRPSINYVLTSQGMAYFPKRYALFSEVLLRELKNEMGSDQLIGYMQKLGKKLANQYRSRFEGRSEEEQVNIMVDLMQELGFHAIMHPDPDTSAVEINAHNCIYHDVAQQFHEICTLDQTLMAELLNKKVELHSCIAKGDGVCSFRMCLGKG